MNNCQVIGNNALKTSFMGLQSTSRQDPTRTLTLRNRFAGDASRRLMDLQRQIRIAVVNLDVFGLKDSPLFVLGGSTLNVNIDPKAFAFDTNPNKIRKFMTWLRVQENKGILETVRGPGMSFAGPAGDGQVPWSNTYVRSSYQRGLFSGRSRLRAKGVNLPPGDDPFGGIGQAFNRPRHIDAVGIAYTRAFDSLEGVTRAMDSQISRVLADGLARGVGPREMARSINNRVSKIGITRARLVARTEVTHAFNTAQLNEFEDVAEAIGEPVKSEWWTSSDERVRSSHAERHGRIFDRKEAEVLIGEPNCRCTLLPYIGSIDKNSAERKKSAKARAEVKARIAKPKRPKAPIGASHAVARKFKNLDHREKYLRYEKEYDDYFKTQSDDILSAPLLDDKTHKLNQMIRRYRDDFQGQHAQMGHWQMSSNGDSGMSFRLKTSQMEDVPMVWGRFYGSHFSQRDKITNYLHEVWSDEQYLRHRAFNQSYMKRVGVKDMTMYRGTGGQTGAEMKRVLIEMDGQELKRTKFDIKDAPVASFSSDPGVARDFGTQINGVDVRLVVPAEYIIVHERFLSGATGRHVKEAEFIIRGGERKIDIKDIDWQESASIEDAFDAMPDSVAKDALKKMGLD